MCGDGSGVFISNHRAACLRRKNTSYHRQILWKSAPVATTFTQGQCRQLDCQLHSTPTRLFGQYRTLCSGWTCPFRAARRDQQLLGACQDAGHTPRNNLNVQS
jgi:hypothetical protein